MQRLRFSTVFAFHFLVAALVLGSGRADCQVETKIVGPPQFCRNLADDTEARYQVVLRFTNRGATTVTARLGTDKGLVHQLFKDEAAMKARDWLTQYNPDYVDTPPHITRHLKPGRTLEWKRTATVYLIYGRPPLTAPGVYYLLPFPDITFNDKQEPDEEMFSADRLIPLTIPAPTGTLRRCRGNS